MLLLTTLIGIFLGASALKISCPMGELEGTSRTSRGGRTFTSFTSVPFAQPPIGPLRFKNPVEASPWNGVLDATGDESPVCTQINYFVPHMRNTTFGQEDCLYLNIFTPKVDGRLPVMVYIHGGGFRAGMPGPASRAEFFMDQDIVLVTIAYRLSALGFLSTEDEVIPGNFGLKDQQMALKWVKENIASFGGDPDLITIFGESAGGASVHFQMLNPESSKLIKRAISQSGTATGLWAIAAKGLARSRAHQMAEALGCPKLPHKEMLDCLQTKDDKKIVETEHIFCIIDYDPAIVYQPVKEKKETPGAFITFDPLKKSSKIPWIVGHTTKEGAFKEITLVQTDPKELKRLEEHIEEYTPMMLLMKGKTDDESAATKMLLKRYNLESKPLPIGGIVDMFSDVLFIWPTEWALKLHKGPAYVYLFDHKGEASFTDLMSKEPLGDFGVCHADELLSLFNYKHLLPSLKGRPEDVKFSEELVKLWTNFAAYGNPSPPGSKVTWLPRSNKREYLHMKTHEFVMEENYKEESIAFSNTLPIQKIKKIAAIKEEL